MTSTLHFGPAQLDSRIAQSLYFSRLIRTGEITLQQAHQVISDSLYARLSYNGATSANPEQVIELIYQHRQGLPHDRRATLTATRLPTRTIDFHLHDPEGFVPDSVIDFLKKGHNRTVGPLTHFNDYGMALYSIRVRP